MEVEELKSHDYTKEVTEAIQKADKIFKTNLHEALDVLYSMEKLTRTAADVVSNSRLVVTIVEYCIGLKDWKALIDQLVIISKKRGQLKQSITKMVQKAIDNLDTIGNIDTKIEVINALRTITEGKIFVEIERARLTRTLSKIKEDQGKINEATDILHELQVETFGSMEKREKTEFILEQIRLGLAKKDYIKTQIISKKIGIKFFKSKENEDLKLKYYNLMIQLSLHFGKYLEICSHYGQIYDSETILADQSKWSEALKFMAIFAVLAPHDNEQHNLLHKIDADKKLNSIGIFKDLVKCLTNTELVRWPKFEEIFKVELQKTFVFDSSIAGVKRWKDLRSRIMEHNIRVISKYYSSITLKRMMELLDLSSNETEEILTTLVCNKTLYAKIDRPAGIVSFTPKRSPAVVLNSWTSETEKLLDLLMKTNHLIAKEEMIHQISGLAK